MASDCRTVWLVASRVTASASVSASASASASASVDRHYVEYAADRIQELEKLRRAGRWGSAERVSWGLCAEK